MQTSVLTGCSGSLILIDIDHAYRLALSDLRDNVIQREAHILFPPRMIASGLVEPADPVPLRRFHPISMGPRDRPQFRR